MWHVVLLIVGAAVIYVACEWFVNAVEWLGRVLRINGTAVGSVLAAIGTALPESVITLIAVTGGSTDEKDIGVGAAMGGPLALSTVAYGVTGLALLRRRRQRHERPTPLAAGRLHRLVHDQQWFLAVFVVKVALGLVLFAGKSWLGLAFFAAYAVYFWRELRAEDDGGHPDEELAPLRLQPGRAAPATWAVVVQTLLTLAAIFFASELFVGQLDAIGPMLGLPAAVTALLLSPIATELPEILNAVIWVRQGKTRLALANISGAMMIQATIPSGIGILFTPWHFDAALVWSGVVTMLAIAYLLVTMRTARMTAGRLAATGGMYVVFAAGLVPILA